MKELLFSNYTELNKENSEWIVLNLLHELRIMTANQLEKLINLEFSYSQSSVYRTLSKLVSLELVDYITLENDSKLKYFYLTKFGHNSIGGLYSFPKRPEYNLNHHIQVTNYLIDSLALAKKKDTLVLAKSERRQMYEKKDYKKNQRGALYHVADYILHFKNKHYTGSDWHFEIELTLKSNQRYMNAIFPKYLNLLTRETKAHVVYVTPSKLINETLEVFKLKFELKERKGELGKVDSEVFSRLHIVPSNQFQKTFEILLDNDPLVNRRID